jgi:hypothetical protein
LVTAAGLWAKADTLHPKAMRAIAKRCEKVRMKKLRSDKSHPKVAFDFVIGLN